MKPLSFLLPRSSNQKKIMDSNILKRLFEQKKVNANNALDFVNFVFHELLPYGKIGSMRILVYQENSFFDVECLRFLLQIPNQQQPWDEDFPNTKTNIMMMNIVRGNCDVIKFLVESKVVNINKLLNYSNEPPITVAARLKMNDIVQYLMDQPNLIIPPGEAHPLTIAVTDYNSELVDILLPYFTEYVHPRTGESMLHIAARCGLDKHVARLLKQPPRIDINGRCPKGKTALQKAVDGFHVKVVSQLVSQPDTSPECVDEMLEYVKGLLQEILCKITTIISANVATNNIQPDSHESERLFELTQICSILLCKKYYRNIKSIMFGPGDSIKNDMRVFDTNIRSDADQLKAAQSGVEIAETSLMVYNDANLLCILFLWKK